MDDNVHQVRGKAADAEKITINLGYVDLGHIDLLVREGFYSNRADFIRTAIRNQIERHAETTKQSVARKSVELGFATITGKTSRPRRRPGRPCTSVCWGWPASPRMSRPSWPAPQSDRSRCSERCTPVRP